MKNCCKESLLKEIDEYSFAAIDLLLYLDTHPEDCKAKADYYRFSASRKKAMEEYARMYGPLTMDYIYEGDEACLNWVMQPWPWELKQKGRC